MRVADLGHERKARHALAVPGFYAVLFGIFFAPVWLRGDLLAPGDGTFEYMPRVL